eukprot:gnl/TRDRNA2_/TRDRNA2_67170_c0_seq1.p1 gnl/TRDRNA2_/TRDRNA2_67170_c0~~gnl/TRDRNA2_/TRDRNA2_67170_c0_seq1.p1  ORF type:complete len:318 (-),score=30.14 gnl/TRDRNA2_/TRDRNA2_67170_c0_seq1:135-1028(-)
MDAEAREQLLCCSQNLRTTTSPARYKDVTCRAVRLCSVIFISGVLLVSLTIARHFKRENARAASAHHRPLRFVAPTFNVSFSQTFNIGEEEGHRRLLGMRRGMKKPREGFEKIRTKEPVAFESLEEGIEYMAHFICAPGPSSFTRQQQEFWRPLAASGAKRANLTLDDPIFANMPATDENIVTMVTIFWCITLYGDLVGTDVHAAYSNKFRANILVRTEKVKRIRTYLALVSAWPDIFSLPMDTPYLETGVAVACDKSYFKTDNIEALDYNCAANVVDAQEMQEINLLKDTKMLSLN